MTNMDPAGYSEAAAHLFTWFADRALGGVKNALEWSWTRAQWAAAQDRYDEQIIKQHGEIRVFGQTRPRSLRDIFVDVHVLDRPTAYRRFDPEKLTEHIWGQARDMPFRESERQPAVGLLTDHDKLFILGKPGAGKTTFLKWLAVRESRRASEHQLLGKLPILVSLKEYSEEGKPLLDFITDQFEVCHFPDGAPFVERLLKEGQALVLFDGLDEVTEAAEADVNRRGQVARELSMFAHEYDGCHIVVTCRIAASEYTFDPCFTYLEVADFTPDQVVAFIRNWFWDEADEEGSHKLAAQMLAEWELPEHKGIRDLGRSPLLLTLLCLSYRDTLAFPSRRVEIYEEALSALLKKWDSSRGIRRHSQYGRLSPGRKQQMFARIAYEGFVSNKVLFRKNDLVGQIMSYLAHVPEMPEAIDIDGEAVLQEIIAQHGIFVEQAQGLFSFAHLTFQEYYAAKYIEGDATEGTLELVAGHIADAKWREVLLLTASLLQDGTPLVRCLEAILQQTAASEPVLARLLHLVQRRVEDLRTTYRQCAARALLVGYAIGLDVVDANPSEFAKHSLRAQARALANALDINLYHDVAIASIREGAHASAVATDSDGAIFSLFALASVHTRVSDLANTSGLASSLAETVVSSLIFACRERHYLDLAASIAGTDVPSGDGTETWRAFWSRLCALIDDSDVLAQLRDITSGSFDLSIAIYR